MTNSTHLIEEQVRRLPLISDDQARDIADRELRQTLFDAITSQAPASVPARTRTGSSTRSRVPRRLVVITAMVAALGLATIGWAVMRGGDVATSTAVGCHLPDGGVAIVDGVTGDPVEDCSRLWSQVTGTPAPELIAYDNGLGGIEVLAATEQVPDEWVVLGRGAVQDPALIELEAALADIGAGLGSECHQLEGARAVTLRELDRLGFADWSVVAERGDADGTNTCMVAIVKPVQQRVQLVPLQGMALRDDDPLRAFARGVHDLLEQECLTTADAAAQVEQVAREAGMEASGINVQPVVDPDAACARAHITLGGGVAVTVRGPAPSD